MSFTREHRERLAGMVNDATIDQNNEIREDREECGQTIHQKIPVSDSILLGIIWEHWKRDILEVGFAIDWKTELARITNNNDFSSFSEEQVKPYQIRAGILLEGTSQYEARMKQQRGSPSFFQTGLRIVQHVLRIIESKR